MLDREVVIFSFLKSYDIMNFKAIG